MPFIYRFLFTLDILANAVIGGSAHQTLSARAHRTAAKGHPWWGWTERFIDRLFFWEKEHCFNTWLHERHSPVPTMTTHDYLGSAAGAVILWLLGYGLLQWMK